MADTLVYSQLAELLKALDLGSLVTTGPDGMPSGWLPSQMQSGVDTAEELYLAVEQTDVFRERYGVITEQRRRAAAGEPVAPMTVAEVRKNEGDFRSIAKYYNFPPALYDSYTDFQNLMIQGITPEQFERSGAAAYAKLAEAPAEVRQVFGEWFGPQGDSVLAAYFLQPDHLVANADRAANTAIAGGISRQYGFGIDKPTAETLAYRGVTPGDLAAGYTTIQAASDLFQETLAEGRGKDLRQEFEGVNAQFDLPGGGDAQKALARRKEERAAAFAGKGGAALSGQGLVGVGAAE